MRRNRRIRKNECSPMLTIFLTLLVCTAFAVPYIICIDDAQARSYVDFSEIKKQVKTSVIPEISRKKPALKKRTRNKQVSKFDVEGWYKRNRKDIVLSRVEKNFSRVIKMVSKRVGIDWRYPIAVAVVESNGLKTDVKNIGSSEEKCVFQVMDGTAKDVEKRFNVNFDEGGLDNPWNCAYAGAGTLKIYFDEFGDMPTVFVAYNRGNTKVRGALEQGINPRETSFYDDKVEYVEKQIF